MSTETTLQTSAKNTFNLNLVLQLLRKACAHYEAGQITKWDADYAELHGGYEAGDLIFNPEDQTELLLSTIDHNKDDPAQKTDSWQAISTGLLGGRNSTVPLIGPQDNTPDQFMTVEQAETLYYPLKGGKLHGKMIIDKNFVRNQETLTQPLGAIFGNVEFFLQLANNPSLGKSFGRLVIRDKDGNEHIGVQIGSDGTITDRTGEPLITLKEAEEIFTLKTDYRFGKSTETPGTQSSTPDTSNGSELFVTATEPHDDEIITKPLGAEISRKGQASSQFYLQLADNSASHQVYGRLELVNKNGDHLQVLEAQEDGSIIPREGYRVMEISHDNPTPMKLLAFRSNYTTERITFPEAFSASPMVMITGHGDRSLLNGNWHNYLSFCSLNKNQKTDLSPDISHSSFSFKSIYERYLDIIAIGPA